jgi:hypothetical protein
MKTKFLLLFTALAVAVAYAGDVERKSFAVSLPKDWTEDTKDENYDPESNIFFENSESCIVMVIIGTKSAGSSTEPILAGQKETWAKRLTEMKEAKFEKWGKYEGKGFELTGKLSGTTNYRARFFGFENATHTCVVIECADAVDAKKFAADFDKIRETFRLK